ncbi:MAG: polymer-forming cytoskeletal protein [Hydrogenophaga sp.]|nr:polymer-forming cytoskeletal protein [Hydrogenophaga sp.]
MEADYVFIEGKVIGTVIARKALEITGSATLIGDASYDELIDMHPRARVRGKIEYRGDGRHLPWRQAHGSPARSRPVAGRHHHQADCAFS